MNYRKLIFIAIIIVCVISIGIGVYREETKTDNSKGIISTIIEKDKEEELSQEEIKKDFEQLFDNELHASEYNFSNIKKINASEQVIYTLNYSAKSDNYELELNIPVVNINNSVGNNLNNNTQIIFADKANDIVKESNTYTIYTVSYTAYVYDNVLSVIIKSNLKEGTSAQRTIVQTYNYDLIREKEITLKEIIQRNQISEKDVSNKIQSSIKEAIKEANKIQVAGYTVYERNLEDEIYEIDNSNNFYINEDGKIYIIYAYGNNSFTSEIDIVAI